MQNNRKRLVVLKKLKRACFSITNSGNHKIFKILGIKIKISKSVLKYSFLLKILDFLLPKNGKKIVFTSFPDFSDNAKEYYCYLLKNYPDEYDLIWICRNPNGLNIPTKSYKMDSFCGMLHMLTAKYFVHTFFSLEDVLCSKRRKNIQLWHGMPLKTIGHMEKNIPAKYVRAYNKNKDAYFFVTSDIFKISMVASFLVEPDNVFITGQPRNDCILNTRNTYNVKSFLEVEKYKKIVLFTPTYKECKRGKNKDIDKEFNNIFYFDDYSKDSLFRLLEELNILLVIKPHPFEEKFYRKLAKNGEFDHPNIKVVYNSDMKENDFYFYEFFQFADLMITDFSSIGIDYLITKKPIIFLNSLADQYNKNRGFVLEDNHEIIMPGEKVYNFYELISAIRDSLTFDSWKERRLKMLPLLHKYTDANSSERVYRIMKELK